MKVDISMKIAIAIFLLIYAIVIFMNTQIADVKDRLDKLEKKYDEISIVKEV